MKAIILYSKRENEYSIAEHNLLDEEARAKVAEMRKTRMPAYLLDQGEFHDGASAEKCRRCRMQAEAVMHQAALKAKAAQEATEAPEWRLK